MNENWYIGSIRVFLIVVCLLGMETIAHEEIHRGVHGDYGEEEESTGKGKR